MFGTGKEQFQHGNKQFASGCGHHPGAEACVAFSRKVFCEGIRDGVPIALGYFAVSFSLGIAARKAGFTPFQGFWPVC